MEEWDLLFSLYNLFFEFCLHFVEFIGILF